MDKDAQQLLEDEPFDPAFGVSEDSVLLQIICVILISY
jgi:hypothetical protein